MPSDTQRTKLEPLLDACRLKGGTPLQDLRRTLNAIPWRHENGAKSRTIPAEFRRWWAAQVFIR